jgi:hypothetical protein
MRKLAKLQHRAMELYHLGGVDAWRYNNGKSVKCNTVNFLVKRGFFTNHGLTEKGRQYIAQHVAL